MGRAGPGGGNRRARERRHVAVYDRDLFFRRQVADAGQLLGTTITGPDPQGGVEGWFEIAYRTADFARGDVGDDGHPDA